MVHFIAYSSQWLIFRVLTESFWQNFPTLIFQFIWPQLTPKLTLDSVYNSERITRQCPSSSFTNKQIQFQFDQEKILSIVMARHGQVIHSVGPIVRPESGRQSPQLGRWHAFGVNIFRVKICVRVVKFSKNFENLKKFHPTNANFNLTNGHFEPENASWGWNLKNSIWPQNFVVFLVGEATVISVSGRGRNLDKA